MTKPITLYSHASGPNGWKWFDQIKKQPFISINPNGRVPAIEDPNTGVTLFESGAIIQYLVDTYDNTNKLAYTTSPEKYLIGPYFGQSAWFQYLHPEKNLTSAIDRYNNEIKRLVGVIDQHLKDTGAQYLVGDKCTYADLAFVMWDQFIPAFVKDWDFKTEAPDFAAWNDRVVARPAVQKALTDKAKAMAAAPPH
ncbi:glutathione S-transferase [Lophium mytilinum]|uniref:Glutathione S-transferase n=1 Tax=Lophium mytilinum TaxID=390894 RepID=A0A6A6RH78_9PEZI|nr:glutathione S-transferase [Lophium mytilinum]